MSLTLYFILQKIIVRFTSSSAWMDEPFLCLVLSLSLIQVLAKGTVY